MARFGKKPGRQPIGCALGIGQAKNKRIFKPQNLLMRVQNKANYFGLSGAQSLGSTIRHVAQRAGHFVNFFPDGLGDFYIISQCARYRCHRQASNIRNSFQGRAADLAAWHRVLIRQKCVPNDSWILKRYNSNDYGPHRYIMKMKFTVILPV